MLYKIISTFSYFLKSCNLTPFDEFYEYFLNNYKDSIFFGNSAWAIIFSLIVGLIISAFVFIISYQLVGIIYNVCPYSSIGALLFAILSLCNTSIFRFVVLFWSFNLVKIFIYIFIIIIFEFILLSKIADYINKKRW